MPRGRSVKKVKRSRGGGYFLDLANSIAPGFPMVNYRNDYFAPLSIGGKRRPSRKSGKRIKTRKHSKRVKHVWR